LCGFTVFLDCGKDFVMAEFRPRVESVLQFLQGFGRSEKEIALASTMANCDQLPPPAAVS